MDAVMVGQGAGVFALCFAITLFAGFVVAWTLAVDFATGTGVGFVASVDTVAVGFVGAAGFVAISGFAVGPGGTILAGVDEEPLRVAATVWP